MDGDNFPNDLIKTIAQGDRMEPIKNLWKNVFQNLSYKGQVDVIQGFSLMSSFFHHYHQIISKGIRESNKEFHDPLIQTSVAIFFESAKVVSSSSFVTS